MHNDGKIRPRSNREHLDPEGAPRLMQEVL